MAVSDEVRIKIITDVKESVRDLAQWGMAIGAAIVSIKKIAEVLNEFVQAAYEDEKIETKLAAVLNATGNAAGYSKDQLLAMGQEMERTTVFSHDAAVEAEALLLTYQNISGDTFPRVMKAAADLSTVFGTDLKSSVTTLGVALENPVEGMNRLRRAGIVFTDEQKAMVKQLQQSGDVFGAQNVILTALEGRVGGAAEMMGNTAYGAAEKLKNEMGELKDTLGAVIVSGIAPVVEGLVKVVGNLNDVIAARRTLGELAGGTSLGTNTGQELAGLQARLVIVRAQMDAIAKEPGFFGKLGRAFAGRYASEEMTAKAMLGYQREELQISLQINDIQEKAKVITKEVANNKSGLLLLENILLDKSEAYAKSEEGKLESLRAMIELLSSPVYNQQGEKVKEALEYLRSQLPVNTAIADETERTARAALDMSEPFRNIAQSIEGADGASISMAESFRNISQSVEGIAAEVADTSVSSENLADLWGDTSQYIKSTAAGFSQTAANVAFAAQDAKVLADNIAKSEKETKDLEDAAGTVAGIMGGVADIIKGDVGGGIRSIVGMMGPWGQALLGVYDIAVAIATAIDNVGKYTAKAEKALAPMAEDGARIKDSLTGVTEEALAIRDALLEAATAMSESFAGAIADAIGSGEWSSVTDAINKQMRMAILDAIVASSGLQAAAEALAEAIQAWLAGGRTSGLWAQVMAARDALLAVGSGINDIFSGLDLPTTSSSGGSRGGGGGSGASYSVAPPAARVASGYAAPTTIIVNGSLIHERELDSRIYAGVSRKSVGY
jgi:hypothetical protein